MARVVDSSQLEAWIAENEYEEGSGGTEPEPPEPDEEPKPLGPSGEWSLVWRDEFDGTAINRQKWNDSWFGQPGQVTKPVNSYEVAAYCSTQVVIGGGVCKLNAIKKTVTAWPNNKTYNYLTGCISSYDLYEFTYGCIEHRIYMPGDNDPNHIPYNWGGLFLNGHHEEWPDAGENDISENLSRGPTWHYHFGENGQDINLSGTGNKPSNGWQNAFHTFTAVWDANGCRYYYNGKDVGYAQVRDPNPKYIVVLNGLSNDHGGALVVPATIQLDYVRVWKPGGAQVAAAAVPEGKRERKAAEDVSNGEERGNSKG